MLMPNLAQVFLQEADDLLADIESAALVMASGNAGPEEVNRIFRAFHTIKGSGAMAGFAEVAAFTHYVETLLDQVRENQIPVSGYLSEIILAAADQIKLLLTAAQGGPSIDAIALIDLLDEIRELSNSATRPQAAAPSGTSSNSAPGHVEKFKPGPGVPPASAWKISFRPDKTIFATGGNPMLLLRELNQLGTCAAETHIGDVPRLSDLNCEVCYLSWTIQLAGDTTPEAIRDVFMFVEDGSELQITPVEAPTVAPKREVFADRPSPVSTAADPEMRAGGGQAQSREATVRVPASRLDRLVSLVGELVMNQSRLATLAARFDASELAEPVAEIERLVAELRDDVLQIRMMPIGSIFGRFRRLVHDLSRQLGKEIELVTEGEETALDKSILDQLSEPLVHLVRNSIDHGIEPVADRVAKGKPAHGTIRLTALHRGSDVVVSIEDDGKGLDRSLIRAKAVSKQLIAHDANLSDKETLNLILLPGFSTAQTVTSLSGRGVGMDVVKRQIDALRGSLNLASEPGAGSIVSLTLPLTLAIIEGLLVEAGSSQYIIPMAVVTENVELPQSERARSNNRNLVAVRGELIPYIDLRKEFQMAGTAPPISKIVLVRHEDQRVGLVVDRVMGTHQTVIQALGRFFRNIGVVSGSTVMGDGRVALILDVPGIVKLAESRRPMAA